jgi:hypothetical protein
MQHKKRVLADGTIKIYSYEQDTTYFKKYYQENKEKILTKITCECGLDYFKFNKKQHYNTKKHIKNMDIIISNN